MQLNDLQLECQKLGADTKDKFGCIIRSYDGFGVICLYDVVMFNDGEIFLEQLGDYEIIGYPIRYDRLCYLKRVNINKFDTWNGRKKIVLYFRNNPELYNQSILEWSDDVLNLVRDFLLSIQ